MDVKLIAMDLDGTLLHTDKSFSERNKRALDAAAAQGIEIVPTTGRIYQGLPQAVRALPYVRYLISTNGGQVDDLQTGEAIHTALLPLDLAFRVYDVLDTLDVAYDCYVDGQAYMDRRFLEKIDDYFVGEPMTLQMIRAVRQPVDDFRGKLRQLGRPLQKLQFFLLDRSRRPQLVRQLRAQFPEISVVHSLPQNVEINLKCAVKGEALRVLCRHLGIAMEQVLAFGDSDNDLTMLQAAGCGVAMANGEPEALAAADAVTACNDEDGVAQYLERYVLR